MSKISSKIKSTRQIVVAPSVEAGNFESYCPGFDEQIFPCKQKHDRQGTSSK